MPVPVSLLTRNSAILYKSLGLQPQIILLLAGVYGTLCFTSNAITTKFLTDQWGRRKYVLPDDAMA